MSQESVDRGLLIIRLGVGAMFLMVHGGPKLLGGPETWSKVGMAMSTFGISFAPVFWGFMAAVSEGIGGLCLMLGVLMRPAAALMAITMVVASTMHVAAGDGLPKASHAIEAAIVFLGLAFTGPGRYRLSRASGGGRGDTGRYSLPVKT
jgi:putative oxidoreductase